MIKKMLLTSMLISTACSAPILSDMTECAKHTDCPSTHDRCYFAHGLREELAKSIDDRRSASGICMNANTMATYSSSTTTTTTNNNAQTVNFLEVDESQQGDKKGDKKGGKKGGKSGSFSLQAPEGNSATIVMGEKSYTLGASQDGDFNVVRDGASEPYLSFKADGGLKSNLLKLSANNIDAKGGFVGENAQGDVLRQWSTISSDTFSADVDVIDKSRGWSLETPEEGMSLDVAKCGGVTMLGGPSDSAGMGGFHRGEVSKIYENLNNHTFVRVSASFHFIDLWLGEFAYMKLSGGSKAAAASSSSSTTVDEYAWTKSYHAASGMGTPDHRHPPSGVNVCGDDNVVEM